jgi:hypothetical protein
MAVGGKRFAAAAMEVGKSHAVEGAIARSSFLAGMPPVIAFMMLSI